MENLLLILQILLQMLMLLQMLVEVVMDVVVEVVGLMVEVVHCVCLSAPMPPAAAGTASEHVLGKLSASMAPTAHQQMLGYARTCTGSENSSSQISTSVTHIRHTLWLL